MTRARDLAAFVSNADGDIKFDTDTLFIDSSANRVGIGTTTPSADLTVGDGATGTKTIALGGAGSGSSVMNLDFLGGGTGNPSGRIGYSSSTEAMTFHTGDLASIAERMRINNIGEINIGTTSSLLSATNRANITLNGTSEGIINLGINGSQGGYLYQTATDLAVWNTKNGPLRFAANNAEVGRFLSGGGLTFNGDTAAANALDDYEEGTWTPNVRGSSTAGSFSGSNIVGWYTKVGDMITVWFDADGTVSGASGNIEISGLPYTSLSGGPEAVGVFMRDGMNTSGTAIDLNLYVPQGQTYMNIFQSFDNASWTVLGTTNETIGIRGTVTYKTA